MSYEFKLSFAELCLFVPSEDLTLLRVLMPNALEKLETPSGFVLPPHTPKLLFDPNDVVAWSSDLDGDATRWTTRTHKGIDYRMLRLDRDNVTVHYDGKPGALEFEVDARDPNHETPQSDEERSDFSWVVDLEQVDPAGGTIDPDCFVHHPTKDLVVARFEITSGSVGTHSFSFDGPEHRIEDPPVTNIARENTLTSLEQDLHQAIAMHAGVTRTVESGNVRIEATRFVEKEPRMSWVELAPRADPTRVLVLALNDPDSEVSEDLIAAVAEKIPDTHEVGLDFLRYYRLTTHAGKSNRVLSRPRPVDEDGEPVVPVGVRPEICTSSRVKAQGPGAGS
jgi:hypothetical protein